MSRWSDWSLTEHDRSDLIEVVRDVRREAEAEEERLPTRKTGFECAEVSCGAIQLWPKDGRCVTCGSPLAPLNQEVTTPRFKWQGSR